MFTAGWWAESTYRNDEIIKTSWQPMIGFNTHSKLLKTDEIIKTLWQQMIGFHMHTKSAVEMIESWKFSSSQWLYARHIQKYDIEMIQSYKNPWQSMIWFNSHHKPGHRGSFIKSSSDYATFALYILPSANIKSNQMDSKLGYIARIYKVVDQICTWNILMSFNDTILWNVTFVSNCFYIPVFLVHAL